MELDTELRQLSALRHSDTHTDQQSFAGERVEEASDPVEGQQFSLPQADGGREAWSFLAACFAVEALIWGR